ncbi:hypothetical protein MHH42_31010 [Bacillus sp. FSL L8-0099]|uniref:hypothetical protein n=1 Tax=unclassified Bacillus (in: firmicutes) TaxID=185979 RepID=UPI0030FA241A
MWVQEQEENEKRRKIVVSCNENNCDGTFTHISWLWDYSPRVDGECSKCKRFISVKLANIDESRIISRKVID